MIADLLITPGERLQKLLLELERTPYQFSKELGYKSPDTIYHIINGKNGMSSNFLNRIKESKYSINLSWLIDGFGTPTHNRIGQNDSSYKIVSKGRIIYPSLLNYDFIKQITEGMIRVVGFEDESFIANVKIVSHTGLEFEFTKYRIKKNKISRDKLYSIILSSDWKVISYYDYWRLDEPTTNCQNLLELIPDAHLNFENEIYKVHKEIKGLINDENFEYDFEDNYLNFDDKFKEIYNNDSRLHPLLNNH